MTEGLPPAIRIEQGVYLALLFGVSLLACTRRFRSLLSDKPALVVVFILLADFSYMLWSTLPYVPLGVDESYYLINAHVYRGSELYLQWGRPPVTGLGAALCPWHPPLVGLFLRSLTIVLCYRLTLPILGSFGALLAVWITATASVFTTYSSFTLSEPYGAAALTAFVLALARGRHVLAGVLSGIAFLSRWPLGFVFPVAVLIAWKNKGRKAALQSIALFVVPVLIVLAVTGADPWRMFSDRVDAFSDKSILASLTYALHPKNGFGLGAIGLLAALIGVVVQVRKTPREPAFNYCLLIFLLYAGILMLMGERTNRFFAPALPLGAVLVACALCHIGALPTLAKRRSLAGLLLALFVLSMAIPVRPPKLRWQRSTSRQLLLSVEREKILAIIGDEALYTDFNFLCTTAVLAHPCHAVLAALQPELQVPSRAYHPRGVSMDWEGLLPAYEREVLPKHVFYLTYEPDRRRILWQGKDLYLVRW